MKRRLSVLYLAFVSIICTSLIGCSIQINASFDDAHNLNYVRPEWFGAVSDGQTDCTEALQQMFNFMAQNDVYVCKFKKCDFQNGQYYLISKTIHVRKPVKIEGRKAYISSRSVITYGNDPKHNAYLSDGMAFRIYGTDDENPRCTDISINIKVHAKPFYLDRLNNAYFHDCYISSFTGDTTITQGIYTYWYAFQCDELSHARFRNIHIDQPIDENKYNSADGIHLSGGCHDILIENCFGQAGDDFIAMNTNENHSGNIYNISVRKCNIGKKTISSAGIRFYGCSRLSHAEGKPQLKISNVSITNCYIRTSLSPCIFFSNNTDWINNDPQSYRLSINNITISNCTFDYLSLRRSNYPAIWIGGTECNNMSFDEVRLVSSCDDISFIGFEGDNSLESIDFKRCRQGGENDIDIRAVNEPDFILANAKENSTHNGVIKLNKSSKRSFHIENGLVVSKKR